MIHDSNVPQFCHRGIRPRPDLERGCEMPCYVLEPGPAAYFTDKSDLKHDWVVHAVQNHIRQYLSGSAGKALQALTVYHGTTGEVLAIYSREDLSL